MSRRTRADIPMPAKVKKLRCAVYTRKSTEEGLDKEFNTLDAQRDACEAYVASQRAEGWVLVHDRYDDGGFSGGTLDRPALNRLLADVERGSVDVIVTYKLDRLSRSLTDFVRAG
jgi:DNA invertase Pin-like site-specific DNA recombinase